jgi:hypothetical protein
MRNRSVTFTTNDRRPRVAGSVTTLVTICSSACTSDASCVGPISERSVTSCRALSARRKW